MREGDNLLIKLPSGVLKAIKININSCVASPLVLPADLLSSPAARVPSSLENSNVSLGKYGTFKAKDLVGKPYGHTYEIVDGGIQVMQATLNEIGQF